MNKEELLKQAKLTDEEIEDTVNEVCRMSSYVDGDENKAIAEAQLHKAYNQPNLYLEVEGDLSDCGLGPEGKPKYLIPLAQAIKET